MVVTTARSAEAAPSGDAVIGLREATKAFGGTLALRNADVRRCVPARFSRCLARMAPAKAPASKCLPAFIRPTLGHVVLDDQPVRLRLSA